MSTVTVLRMPSPPRPSTPLRHPQHQSQRQKTPSPSFTERFREKQRADVVARARTARETAANDARGGEDEIMRVIFRGEEKRRQASMEKEANRIHHEALDRIDENEEVMQEDNPDMTAFEEMMRKEEEEVLALLMAKEVAEINSEMEDILMSDIDIDEG